MPVYFAAELPSDLAADVRSLIDRVRDAPHPAAHAREGVAMILRLTEANLDYYFARSVRLLGLGTLSEATVRVGLRTALGGIGMFVRGLSGSLSDEQVRRLADLLDGMLLERP